MTVTVLSLAAEGAANHATVQRISTGPAGGNGAEIASFHDASADGTRVLFTTRESLEPGDTDAYVDIYERFGSTTTRISTGTLGGNGPYDAVNGFEGAAADATRVFFGTREQLEPDDTNDFDSDVYERFGSTTTRISTGPTEGNPAHSSFEGASADGTRVWFRTAQKLVPEDTDAKDDIYQRSGSITTLISTGPAGGNADVVAGFVGASADGTRVFFLTVESLVAGDTDTYRDIYERLPDVGVTNRLSGGPAGGNGAFDASFQGASADGTRVFFGTQESLVAGDTDLFADLYQSTDSGSTTTQITAGAGFRGVSADGTRVFLDSNERLAPGDVDDAADVYVWSAGTSTWISAGSPGGNNGNYDAIFAGASADGTRVFFHSNERLAPGDTDFRTDVYERSGSTTTRISTGPTGGNGNINALFLGASADGARVFFRTNEPLEAGDTDTRRDIYERFGSATTRISTGPAGGNGNYDAIFAAAAADGTRVFFETFEPLLSEDTDGYQDVYGVGIGATTGYPRPLAATPFRVALVPLYEECTEPNTGHAAPFAFEACNPPVPASHHLTVGTPDANGAPAKFAGFLRIGALAGAPGGADEADAAIKVQLTDIRNQGDLSDYTGELRAIANLRLTDKAHGPSATLPGTTSDFPLSITVPCSATGDATVGGSCALTTSLDTLVPGAVKEGKRGIYKLDAVEVLDGGSDGDVDTPAGDTQFAAQGFFVP